MAHIHTKERPVSAGDGVLLHVVDLSDALPAEAVELGWELEERDYQEDPVLLYRPDGTIAQEWPAPPSLAEVFEAYARARQGWPPQKGQTG